MRKDRLLPKIHTFHSLFRDPNIYPDYEEFRPERFLDQDGKYDIPQNTHGQGHVTYGKHIDILYSKYKCSPRFWTPYLPGNALRERFVVH